MMSAKLPQIAPGGVGFLPQLECVPCLVRQAREAISFAGVETTSSLEVLRQALRLMTELDWNLPPPALAQQVHRLIRQMTGCSDPYAAVKERLNKHAAELYPIWHRRFRQTHSPMEAAVRLAIVGNLLDVGAKTELDAVAVRAAFDNAVTAPLRGSVEDLSSEVRRARSILYLADNVGEIVFDRDLLAQLPTGTFAVGVRGRPVLNDATLADAVKAGLANLGEVISNGSDAPGTILEDCSPAFRKRFEAADLVISKGQGNYETLVGTNKHIFFLLKIKCDVLSEALGLPRGSLVLRHQRPAGLSKGGAWEKTAGKSCTRTVSSKNHLENLRRNEAITPAES